MVSLVSALVILSYFGTASSFSGFEPKKVDFFSVSYKNLMKKVGVTFSAILLSNNIAPALPAIADSSRVVGEISTSGIIFKDTLKISAFEDPKLPGVSLYLSDFDRPITEKLSKDFFNDPSSSSLTCVQNGPVDIANSKVSLNIDGEEVFEESKNLFFKTIRVRRIVDTKTNTIIYVSYSSRINKESDSNKGRFKSSLCAVHIN